MHAAFFFLNFQIQKRMTPLMSKMSPVTEEDLGHVMPCIKLASRILQNSQVYTGDSSWYHFDKLLLCFASLLEVQMTMNRSFNST